MNPTTTALSQIATRWNRFALVGMLHPVRPGQRFTAQIIAGDKVLARAHAATPERASELLLAKLSTAAVAA